ncbi:MAG: polymer-forming cytoskeletal protein [Rhodoferax sp.]|jgi:cytoskeletal protein CcmA (bactofilin family)|nr:polymer-forming cytoskeletal protein [Rhodoferax sp.]
MFNKKKQPPLKSLVARGARVVGDIFFAEGMRVECSITGNVSPVDNNPSILVIAETAVITGAVSADHIIINGSVKGAVSARLMLELQPNARIEGDVEYGALEMHQGALISGRLTPILGDAPMPALATEAIPD